MPNLEQTVLQLQAEALIHAGGPGSGRRSTGDGEGRIGPKQSLAKKLAKFHNTRANSTEGRLSDQHSKISDKFQEAANHFGDGNFSKGNVAMFDAQNMRTKLSGK